MNLAKAEFNPSTSELVIADELRLPVPIDEIGKLPRTSMTVGVRPENLYPITPETKAEDVFHVEVTNVEILGNETVFSFKLGGEEWMAKWSGQWHIDIGDRMPVRMEFESLSIFDEQSGELIKGTIDYGKYVKQQKVSP